MKSRLGTNLCETDTMQQRFKLLNYSESFFLSKNIDDIILQEICSKIA